MDYRKHYELLVERAKTRQLDCYKEKHRIIPGCMGGTYAKNNVVQLTPEEHYVAHQLLVKMYPEHHGLVKAAAMMVPNRPSNKLYGWLRRRHAVAQSISQTGNGNSQHGTRWIHNLDLKESKKIRKDKDLPDGWLEGRKIDFSEKPPKLDLRKIQAEQRKKEAYEWYGKFLNSNCSSIREFVRESEYDKSHVAFINMLKRYVSEFNPTHGKKFIPVGPQGVAADC